MMIVIGPLSSVDSQARVLNQWQGLHRVTSASNPAFQLALIPNSTDPEGSYATMWDDVFLQAYQYDKLSQLGMQQAQLNLAMTEAQIPVTRAFQRDAIRRFQAPY